MHLMSQGLFPNTSQSGPYRGAGRPEAAYFMERLIEHAANEIGMDPAEIRRRNLIPPNKLPYATPTLWNYDSGEFVRLLDKCIENSDWNGYPARKRASEKDGKLRGRAVSYYIEFGGIFNERMDLRFNPDGTLNVMAGTHSHGQGHATVFAQLVHEPRVFQAAHTTADATGPWARAPRNARQPRHRAGVEDEARPAARARAKAACSSGRWPTSIPPRPRAITASP